jgi:hypothetical protein
MNKVSQARAFKTLLQGIEKCGWVDRLKRANWTRLRKQRLQKEAREAEALRIATLQARRLREQDVAAERAHKQALKELAAQLQYHAPRPLTTGPMMVASKCDQQRLHDNRAVSELPAV